MRDPLWPNKGTCEMSPKAYPGLKGCYKHLSKACRIVAAESPRPEPQTKPESEQSFRVQGTSTPQKSTPRQSQRLSPETLSCLDG